MNISRVNVRRLGAHEDAAFWVNAVENPRWQSDARSLKQDGHAWVRRVVLPDRAAEVVIKCRPATGPRERFKSLVRSTRGDRQWRGACWLIDNGVATARPLLLATATVDHVPCELLVTEYIEAPSVLDHLARGDLSIRDQHLAARAIGRLVTDLHRKNRFNRDGKPSNLLLARTADGFSVAIIDTVAIRPARGERSLHRSLANLFIEPFGAGCPPRRTLQARVMREITGLPPSTRYLQAWKLTRSRCWTQAMKVIADHGDPRPRIDPRQSR